MRHPFDLDPSELKTVDLDFGEQLTDEEAAQVGGGLTIYTTEAVGEEGGGFYPLPYPLPYPYSLPYPKPYPKPIGPPLATTMALGEEGGNDGDYCSGRGHIYIYIYLYFFLFFEIFPSFSASNPYHSSSP